MNLSFQYTQDAITLAPGETYGYSALEYLTVMSSTGTLQLAAEGTGVGSFAPLATREVIGDGVAPIGKVVFRNGGLATLTAVVLTSTRRIAFDDQGPGAVVTVTGFDPAAVVKIDNRETATATTGAIAGVGQSVVAALAGANGASFYVSGVYASVGGTFEVSYDGGTTYVPVSASGLSSASASTSTGTLTNASQAWEVYAPGATHARLRATAWTSGSMSVRIVPIQGAQDPCPLPPASISAKGTVSAGTAIGTDAPVMQGVSDGTNVQRMRADTTGAILLGNTNKRTYHLTARAIAATAANYVIFTINAGASAGFRLRSLWLMNPGMLTAPALGQFELLLTTAASSGGTAQTPAKCEAADAAFTGIARTAGATITAGGSLFSADLWIPGAVGSFAPVDLLSTNALAKDITIAAGVANGLALRLVNGAAGAASLAVRAVITEE